jgi:hypothetical protein
MAASVVTSWSGSQTMTAGTPVNPPPTSLSLQVSVANTAGDWMIAVIAWNGIINPTAPTVTVADNAHNWWEPLFSPESTSSASGNVRCSIWMAPAAMAAEYVNFAPNGPMNAIAATIYDVTGMKPWVSTACVTAFANSVTSLGTMNAGAPGSSAIAFTVCAADATSPTISLGSGAGWSAVTTETVSGQLTLASAYQVLSGSLTSAWSSSGTTDLAGCMGFAVAAPAALTPRSAYWPVSILEMGFGSGFQTPADAIVWQPVTTAYLTLNVTQGRQYETAQLSAGEGTLYLDNPYKQLVPTQTVQAQVQFSGNGSTAYPYIQAVSNALPVTADVLYTFSAYIWSSAAWSSGAYAQIEWLTSSLVFISYSSSATVATSTTPGLYTVTAAAPATAAYAVIQVVADLTPPATTAFYAAGAAGSTLQVPSGVPWTGANNATVAQLLPWNAFQEATSGTPVRLRANWGGGTWQVQFSGNGSTANPNVSATAAFGNSGFAGPGLTYQVAAWVGMSAPWTAGVTLQMNFYNGSLGLLETVTSAQTATTTSPSLLTVSAVAPAASAFINAIIQVSGTPAASLVFSAAAAPVIPGGGILLTPPAQPWAGANGATISSQSNWVPEPAGPPEIAPWYVPFSGFIERLPQQWDTNLRGFTEATVTDYWFACNYQPQPVLPQEILNDFPYAYWPLTDPAGTLQASNLAPGNPNTLNVFVSKYGAGGVATAFDTNTGAMLGAQSTLVVSSTFTVTQEAGMWQLSNTNSNGGSPPLVPEGVSLSCTDSGFPPISGGITIECWVQATSPYSPIGQDVWILADAEGPSIQLYWANNGVGYFYNYTRNGTLLQVVADARDYTTYAGLIQTVMTFNETTWTFYINGLETMSGTFTSTLPAKFSSITVNGAVTVSGMNIFGNYASQNFNGYTGQVAIFPYELTAARIYTHYLAGNYAMAGEPDYYRIERLLTAGNALGRRCILQSPAGEFTPIVSTQDIASQAASASIMNMTGDLLPAIFYIAPTGDMFYLEKSYAWDEPVQWALGDEPSNGEIPYQGDIRYDFDPTRVINEIQLTQLDDESITTSSLTAIEAASQEQYGTETDIATGYLQIDANYPLNSGPSLGDLANWLAATYQAPVLRVSAITLEAQSFPAAWPAILGISVGDMVTIARRPPGSGSAVLFLTGRVTQTQRTFEFSARSTIASVQLMVDPAPEEYALTCDDPVRGQLNGTDILGW